MNLWVAFWSARRGVNVVASEIATKVESFLDVKIGKVLVAECYDFLLGYEQCELIFASISQLAQLHPMDLSTNIRGNVVNFGVLQEIRKRWVRILAMLLVLKCSQRRISGTSIRAARFIEPLYSLLFLIVPDRKIVGISCRRVLLGTSELEFLSKHLWTTKRGFLVLSDTRLVTNRLLLNNLFYESGSHNFLFFVPRCSERVRSKK
jgi:hypothetical protein